MRLVKSNILLKAAIALLPLAMVSCTPKNIGYLQDIEVEQLDIVSRENSIKIKPEDKLSIVVKTSDPAITELFNLSIVSNRLGLSTSPNGASSINTRTYTSQSEGLSYYTVSPQGTIDFPVLGIINLQGMTRGEAAGFIKGELMGRNLAKDPIVTVEFIGTGISILGEVKTPGRYDINKDHLNVLEALALAGDLDIQGKRENVLVLREVNGEMHTYRLDLTKGQQLMKSPAFYLQQNDVIYVEPNQVKKRQATVNGNTMLQASFWVSIASVLASLSVLIFR